LREKGSNRNITQLDWERRGKGEKWWGLRKILPSPSLHFQTGTDLLSENKCPNSEKKSRAWEKELDGRGRRNSRDTYKRFETSSPLNLWNMGKAKGKKGETTGTGQKVKDLRNKNSVNELGKRAGGGKRRKKGKQLGGLILRRMLKDWGGRIMGIEVWQPKS